MEDLAGTQPENTEVESQGPTLPKRQREPPETPPKALGMGWKISIGFMDCRRIFDDIYGDIIYIIF